MPPAKLRWAGIALAIFLAACASPSQQTNSGSQPDAHPGARDVGIQSDSGPSQSSKNDGSTIGSYYEANRALRNVYQRLIDEEPGDSTLYCHCSFDPKTKRAAQEGCSFNEKTARRYYKVHWEHVVPAARLGRGMACWKDGCENSEGDRYGGRRCCRKQSAKFRLMEADMHNLRPAIGTINIARQDYDFGEIPGEERRFGACDFEINAQARRAEPEDSIRGIIARSYLYMDLAYDIGLTAEEKELFERWDREHPPEEAELARNRLIRSIQGNGNPFIEWRPTLTDSEEGLNPNRSSCLLQ